MYSTAHHPSKSGSPAFFVFILLLQEKGVRSRKWVKVKDALLAPQAREEEDMSQSLPSSPNKRSDPVFFYDDNIFFDPIKNDHEEQVTVIGVYAAAT